MTPAASKPTVIEALRRVMEEVQAVGKTDRNTQQNYNFRGIDAVVNAVGPALRTHGVIVVPVTTTYDAEHYQTAKGTPMRSITLTVGFRFYGPAGDFIEATVCGEAADSGDKAVPKAHSVAYRTLLLQALCIPTDEPDPDAESYTRGNTASAGADGAPAGQATAPRARPSPGGASEDPAGAAPTSFEPPAGASGTDGYIDHTDRKRIFGRWKKHTGAAPNDALRDLIHATLGDQVLDEDGNVRTTKIRKDQLDLLLAEIGKLGEVPF